jgi:LysM repeat protein
MKAWALPLLLAASSVLAPVASAQTPHKAPAKKATKPAPKGENGIPLDEESIHLVRPGETLGGIAARAKVPRILIAEANGLKQPYSVHAGQRLILPRTRHHVVKDGESGFDIAYHYGVPLSSILVANGLKEGTKLKAGQKLLIPTMLHGARPGDADGLADEKPAGGKPEAKPAPKRTMTTIRATAAQGIPRPISSGH